MSLSGHISNGASPVELFTSLDDLPVPTYDFVQDGLTPGAWVKRRQIAESMYVDDAFQVQSSKARIPGSFGFFVTAPDAASLESRTGDLLAAIDQAAWNLHVTFDAGGSTAEWAWSCWDGEPNPGFPATVWDTFGRWLWQPVTVTVQRSPIPVAGPF